MNTESDFFAKMSDSNGLIGYVQRVGALPQSLGTNDTMEYGTGAFLLAAKEMSEIVIRNINKI